MGDLIVVKACTDGLCFVFCPHCGCAWRKPPPQYVVDSVDLFEAFAPTGFRLPTDADLAQLRRHGWPVTALEPLDDSWRECLAPGLQQP